MSRNFSVAIAAVVFGTLSPAIYPAEAHTVVLMNPTLAAHREALDGIRSHAPGDITALDVREAVTGVKAPVGGRTVVVTLGIEALRTAATTQLSLPVVSAMVLRTDVQTVTPAAIKVAGAVSMDVPLPAILARLRRHFPGKTRVGLIYNRAAQADDVATLESQARQLGFSPTIVECARADELLRAFPRLRGKIDFLICFPDAALFNSSTVRPLVTSSLENRLALVGFSASFVGAGAAVGIYPDFHEVGVQAGEAAARALEGRTVRDESPRKLIISVNQRVLRLLGLDIDKEHLDGVAVVR